MQSLQKRKGFTLIELLVVIFILGVLASLISNTFFTSLKKGRDARRKADLEQIQKGLEIYYEDNRAYPTQAPDPGFLFGNEFSKVIGTKTKIYMKKVPNDPINGLDYKYVYDSTEDAFKLYACMENNQQILPYDAALSPAGGFTCSTECFARDGQTQITCIWGLSSPNTIP